MEKTLRAALTARTILRYGEEVFSASGMDEQRAIMQHGATSVLSHCIGVTFTALCWAKRFHLRIDERSLVRGALLHDYFLYDWHKPGHGHLHGFTHPKTAFENARKEFELNAVERDVIRRHMFPLTPAPPRYKEAWLVCAADKVCALCETFHIRVMSGRLMEAMEKGSKK